MIILSSTILIFVKMPLRSEIGNITRQVEGCGPVYQCKGKIVILQIDRPVKGSPCLDSKP